MSVAPFGTSSLVNTQRNELLQRIRGCEDADQLLNVRNLYEMVRPWLELTGYKSHSEDIRLSIRVKAVELRIEEQSFLEGERKNSKNRYGSEKRIRQLTDILGTMG